MTIVLLDDELFLLKALQRTINRIYPSAQVISVNEVDQFWEVLKKNKNVDLVISDYLMPHVNGLDVLERCVVENPYPVRVLLTGDTTLTTKLRSSNVVHTYLAKPFNQEDLTLLFNNVAELKSLPFSHAIRRELGGMSSFPVYPLLLKQLNKLIDSGDFDLAKVSALVSKEPIVVAKLLQLANSAYLGFKGKTSSIEEAVSRLGTTILLSITTSLFVVKNFQASITPAEHEQLLSVATKYASCVKKFAKHVGMKQKEQALLFSVALLSFVGKLILLEGHKDQETTSGKCVTQEQQGINYLHISAYVMKLWGHSTQICSLIMNLNTLQTPSNDLNASLFIVQQKLFNHQTNQSLIECCQHHGVSSSLYEAIGTFSCE